MRTQGELQRAQERAVSVREDLSILRGSLSPLLERSTATEPEEGSSLAALASVRQQQRLRQQADAANAAVVVGEHQQPLEQAAASRSRRRACSPSQQLHGQAATAAADCSDEVDDDSSSLPFLQPKLNHAASPRTMQSAGTLTGLVTGLREGVACLQGQLRRSKLAATAEESAEAGQSGVEQQ